MEYLWSIHSHALWKDRDSHIPVTGLDESSSGECKFANRDEKGRPRSGRPFFLFG